MKIAIFAACALFVGNVASSATPPDVSNASAVWTLWLATFATNQGGTPVITALATFPTESGCIYSLETVSTDIHKEFSKNTPMPGLMFCVFGAPIKR